MSIKQITNLTVFITAFIISVSLAGMFKSVSEQQAEKISVVITQDVKNAFSHPRSLANYAHYVRETEGYVSASENIDFADVPEDFAQAWLEHMQAWRDHADNLNPEKKTCLHSISRISYQTISNDNEEITRTWEKVLRVAEKHGAYIPPQAY